MRNFFIIVLGLAFLTACDANIRFHGSPRVSSDEQKSKQESKIIAAQISRKPELMPSLLNSRPLESMKPLKKKVKVALFFPLSGKNKELGFSLYNAATMSLFDNDINHNLELVLIDSKDGPSNATKNGQDITDQNIKIVIGPVFSSSVEAVAKNFMNNSITAISLSNNQQLSEKINNTGTGGTFIAGFLPEQQIEKIVTYAIDHDKINFAILAPNNQYGITTSAILKRTVAVRDGRIITSEFYNPAGDDLEKVVARLVNAFLAPKDLAQGGGGKNKINKNKIFTEADRTYPQVIFIPESGKILTKITALIKQYNLEEREYQLIGTSQWDDISALNDPNLVGAWFASSPHERFAGFERSYYQTYNKFPPRIASIVYDAVATVAELVDKKNGQIPDAKDFINYTDSSKNKDAKNGFDGIDGIFRFLNNGLVQRNLAVLQINNGGFGVIDKPAEKLLKF